MDYRSLGPVELSEHGTGLRVGGPRQQIVLSLLLAAGGRVVPVHDIVDALWGDDPPATARSQVQICVSGLRRQLETDGVAPRIETAPPGYRLLLGAGDTSDLVVFEDLVAAGMQASADGDLRGGADLLLTALELWRGEPFGGLGATSAQLRDLTQALWERRTTVGSALVEIEFALGNHAEVINQLRREVDRDPLAERARGYLMIALHGAGRQAEALREYRIARELLVEELGIEPGAELREIERQILTGELPVPVAALTPEPEPDPLPPTPPVAPPSSTVPRLLPPGVADFTGRERELEQIVLGLAPRADAAVRAAPVALVVGSPGVGKSALAVQVGWHLAPQFPDGQLYADLHGIRGLSDLGIVERFLRALGTPANALPEHADERLALYRQLLSDRRVLIVLDDAASEDQIRPLLPGSGTCAVLVTSRRRLSGIPGALTLELPRFRPEESVELLAQVLGRQRVDDDPEGAAMLVQVCDHLPLAVRIAAARLAARPHWSPRLIAERLTSGSPLDELHYGELAVRESVLLTYDQLTAPVQRLFRMIGLFDSPDFGEWLARPLHDDDQDLYPEDMLAELVEMHLLDVTMVDGTPRYAMHDLVRATARERAAAEDPTQERFETLHRAFRTLLVLLDEAHGAVYGGDYLSLHGSTERPAVRDRDLAEVRRSPATWHARESRFIVAAVARSADLDLPGVAWEIALRSVAGFEANHDLDAWRSTHETARVAVQDADDRLGLAAIDYSLGSLAVLSHDLVLADELLGAAAARFASLERHDGVALVQRNQAFVALQRGDLDLAASLAEPAVATFRRTEDRLGEAYALRILASRNIAIGDLAAAVDQLEYAVTLCRDIDNRRMTAQVMHRLGTARLALGELEESADLFIKVLSLVRETGDSLGEVHALLGAATVARRQGADADAQEMLDRADEIAAATGERRVQALVQLERGRVLGAAGRHARAEEVLEAAAMTFRTLSMALPEAETLMELGDVHHCHGQTETARARWAEGLDVLATLPRCAAAQLHGELLERTSTGVTR